MNTPETKSFPLRVVLTAITGRLLTERKSEQDNGISDLYDILEWMTGEAPFTHQLGRFADECQPWLFKWHPELGLASASLPSLDKWLRADRTDGQQAINMWLTELKMMSPHIKDSYDIPRIPREYHVNKNPIEELVKMRARSRIG